MLKLVLVLLQILILCTKSTLAATKNVELYGLNYSPRKGADWQPDNLKCKSRSEIKQDLQTMSTLTNRVRIYSLLDCDQGREVLSVATELNMKLWLGIWVGDNATIFQEEKRVLKEMLTEGLFEGDTIIGMHVGSEAVYRNDVSATKAIAYYEEISEILDSNDLESLTVTVADIAHIYKAHPSLAKAVDVVSANAFPFWSPGASAGNSMPGLINYLNDGVVLPDKDLLISETGWASEGSNGNSAKASPENQAAYFKSFYCAIAIGKPSWKYYYFTGIDNAWRAIQDDQDDDVEGHFGIFDKDRVMKPHFKSLEFSCPGDSETTYLMAGGLATPEPTTTEAPTTTSTPTTETPSGSGSDEVPDDQAGDSQADGTQSPPTASTASKFLHMQHNIIASLVLGLLMLFK